MATKIVQSLVYICLFSVFLYAQHINYYEKQATYDANEDDCKSSCRKKALVDMKSVLLDEIGAYMISENSLTKIETNNDFKSCFKSQIKSFTPSIVTTKLLDESWDGKKYFLKCLFGVDVELLRSYVNQQLNGCSPLTGDLKEIGDRLSELERMKGNLTPLIQKMNQNDQAIETQNERIHRLEQELQDVRAQKSNNEEHPQQQSNRTYTPTAQSSEHQTQNYTITVNSDPPGAEVFYDFRSAGVTPCEVEVTVTGRIFVMIKINETKSFKEMGNTLVTVNGH
jgi:hypothetical protein